MDLVLPRAARVAALLTMMEGLRVLAVESLAKGLARVARAPRARAARDLVKPMTVVSMNMVMSLTDMATDQMILALGSPAKVHQASLAKDHQARAGRVLIH